MFLEFCMKNSSKGKAKGTMCFRNVSIGSDLFTTFFYCANGS